MPYGNMQYCRSKGANLTVQEKEVRFPTDARLYDRARQRLVAAAEKRGIPLRQNYYRNSKKLILKQSRYAHAKQMKRAGRCTSKLKPYLGRVIRDIVRKQPVPDDKLASLKKEAWLST